MDIIKGMKSTIHVNPSQLVYMSQGILNPYLAAARVGEAQVCVLLAPCTHRGWRTHLLTSGGDMEMQNTLGYVPIFAWMTITSPFHSFYYVSSKQLSFFENSDSVFQSPAGTI